MSKREEIRKYRMSDATLIQLADDIADSARRDAADLEAYGVTPATISEIETMRRAFRDTPTDEQLSGKMVGATNNKNIVKQQLLIKIRQVADRARIKYGDNHQIVREFGVEMLSRQDDNELSRTGYRVLDVAREYQAELQSEGLTETIIEELQIVTENFDTLIDLQKKAIKNRDIAVDNRIKTGNNLYSLVVTLAAKGKLCWGEVNVARYNDYVLNESRSMAGHVTDGTVAANSVVNISVTGITPLTVMTIENTGDAPLTFYFSVNPMDVSGPQSVIVEGGAIQTLPVNTLGYNEDTNMTRFNVNNNSAMAGRYSVEWI